MITAAALAVELGGELVGDGALVLRRIAPAEAAQPGDLTFAEKEAYLAAAEQSPASAVIVPASFTSTLKTLIRVANPRIAIAKALPLFFPPDAYPPGIDPGAAIDPAAEIDPTANVGPHCVIGAGVKIGPRAVLMGGNHIGRDCRIGEETRLHPNVVLYARTEVGRRVVIHAGTVIGSDGYGYVFDQGRHRKVLQVGNVVVHDDVEIGANAAIDRAALGSTIIGQGCKIDNLVHLAHNVVLGRHCLVLGQAGLAGSTRLGDYVVLASQAGVAGHLTIGARATIGAQSGVMRDVPEGATVLGSPAFPDKQTKRQWVAATQLPEMARRLRELEKEVAALRERPV